MARTPADPIADLYAAVGAILKETGSLRAECFALERLAMSAAAMAAKHHPDPMRFCDELRRMALDPVSKGEGPIHDEARDRLELMLGKIESATATLGPPQRQG